MIPAQKLMLYLCWNEHRAAWWISSAWPFMYCGDWWLHSCWMLPLQPHNTQQKKSGSSTVLCRSQWQKWWSTLLSPACSPCTSCVWREYECSHGVYQTALWEACFICNLTSVHTFPSFGTMYLPWPVFAGGMNVPVCFTMQCTVANRCPLGCDTGTPLMKL